MINTELLLPVRRRTLPVNGLILTDFVLSSWPSERTAATAAARPWPSYFNN